MRLVQNVDAAVDWWLEAGPVAAANGDHKAAKDLLLHAGTIEPLNAEGTNSVRVFVSVQTRDGRIEQRDNEAGELYDPSANYGGKVVSIGIPLPGITARVTESDDRGGALTRPEDTRETRY